MNGTSEQEQEEQEEEEEGEEEFYLCAVESSLFKFLLPRQDL